MHTYYKVEFDGEKYHYFCDCGHEVITTDGMIKTG